MSLKIIQAELLKTRRTLALALAFVAPLVIVSFVVGFYYMEHEEYFRPGAGQNPWNQLLQMILVYWNLLMMPMFAVRETALIAQLEHGPKNWKLLYTQPVPRRSIYIAKLLVCLGWIAISNIVLLGATLAAGRLLQAISPTFGLDAPFPWRHALWLIGLSYLAGWFMIAFHLWVASRWPSFVVAMGTGVVAAIFTVFVFGEEVANYIPWTIPGAIVSESMEPEAVGGAVAICLAGAVLAILLGGWDVLRRAGA